MECVGIHWASNQAPGARSTGPASCSGEDVTTADRDGFTRLAAIRRLEVGAAVEMMSGRAGSRIRCADAGRGGTPISRRPPINPRLLSRTVAARVRDWSGSRGGR
jgi:hypothetical protein